MPNISVSRRGALLKSRRRLLKHCVEGLVELLEGTEQWRRCTVSRRTPALGNEQGGGPTWVP
jgi:hypothetical protein